jgi:hypothetical protein
VSSVDFEQTQERRRRVPARPFVPESSRVPLAQSRARSGCPELDCLRARLPPGTLATAEQRALALGIGADRVLIAAGIISEDEYVRALAGWLHVPFERLDLPRDACPLPDTQFIDAAQFGLLPLRSGDAFIYVVAPQVLTARRLVTGAHPLPKDRFRLTSPQRLRQFVLHHGADALGKRAAEALRGARPELSAAVCPPPVRAAWLAGIAAVVSAAIVFHEAASVLTSAVLALTFLAWTALRLVGAATAWRGWRALRMPVHDLPIYTVIVALYDEAIALPGLIAALRRLDYPREKLQIILVLEPDDHATPRRAGAARPRCSIRSADRAGCWAAYQAEGTQCRAGARTRHIHGGLRRRGPAGAGPTASCARCVRGRGRHRLRAGAADDRQHRRRLARAAVHREYAGLFDVLLPGTVGAQTAAAAWRLVEPLPHRTRCARSTGGMPTMSPRTPTSACGSRASVSARGDRLDHLRGGAGAHGPLDPPAHPLVQGLDADLARSHAPPGAARAELGLAGFLTFQLVVGGTVLSALVHPVFIAMFGYALATKSCLRRPMSSPLR